MHGSAIIGQSFSTFCHCVGHRGHRPAVVRVRAGRGALPCPLDDSTTTVNRIRRRRSRRSIRVHLRPDRMMYYARARARSARPLLLLLSCSVYFTCSVFVALRPRQPLLITQVMGCFIRSKSLLFSIYRTVKSFHTYSRVPFFSSAWHSQHVHFPAIGIPISTLNEILNVILQVVSVKLS